MDAQIEQQVRERAFELWQGGAVHGGSDIDYWVAAESEVKAKLASPKKAAPAKKSAPKSAAPKAAAPAPAKKTAAKAKK